MAPERRPPSIHRSFWLGFGDFDAATLYALLKLRGDVFVVEQNCPFAEIDGRDSQASHFLVWLDAEGPLSGCLRVFAPDVDGPHARIGRVATSRAAPASGDG